jgi:Na+/H+ antiporter NhaD/arsenite permease-like protein
MAPLLLLASADVPIPDPNPWMILPFAALLLAIAVGPLAARHWWEKNYSWVAIGLGLIAVLYYAFGLEAWQRIALTAHEYLSFIALIGSLFIVAGGIHINVKGQATPLVNTAFLALGALVSNLIGTTGASMLLIRPWIRMNKFRITAFHIVIFIFIVSNCGGSLTPIGDPPLFLGYLKGIPFFWVMQHCWPGWLMVNGLLLLLFFYVDSKNFQKAPVDIARRQTAHEEWSFLGLHNLLFLALILGAVFLNSPWRELVMAAAAAGSFFTTGKQIHDKNDFNFGPIKEVAILFLGIFGAMMPALDYLQTNADNLGRLPALAFYFGSGALSSVLDNAPTYLAFLSASIGQFVSPDTVGQVQQMLLAHGTGSYPADIEATYQALVHYSMLDDGGTASTGHIQIAYLIGNLDKNLYIVAVSLGSVFFGAMTYIGNGPNFMVKAIADHAKVETPHFAEYIYRYSLPFLFPILAVTGWILLR